VPSLFPSNEHSPQDFYFSQLISKTVMAAKLITIICALALSTFVSASIHIPADSPDGVYSQEFGTENVTLISEITPEMLTKAAAAPNFSNLSKRYTFPVAANRNCINNEVLSRSDWNNAYNVFWGACSKLGGSTHVKGPGLIIKIGSVVTYMCNYSGKGNPCSTDEYTEAGNILINGCAGSTNSQTAGKCLRLIFS
jgi:hypothetical protein